MNLKCALCNVSFDNFRTFSTHIKREHELTSETYYLKFNEIKLCKFCKNQTSFKNLNEGFRNFCNKSCTTSFRMINDNSLREKLAKSQMGRFHRSMTSEEKEEVSKNMKKIWQNPSHREKRLNTLRSLEVRNKISKSVVEHHYVRKITFIESIKCESKAEEKFVKKCKQENIKIERFHHDSEKSIHLSDGSWKIPDFLLDNVIVEVKDFHPWFKNEIYSGLIKYKKILQWALEHGYIYLFWIPKYGYKTIEKLQEIKNPKDLDIFLKENTDYK